MILYLADCFMGDQLFAPCVTMFAADDEDHDNFIRAAREHFGAVKNQITNEHIEADFSYRVRLALIGKTYRPGNYGEFKFSDIFNNFAESEDGDNECIETDRN